MNAGRLLRETGYDTDALRVRITPVNPDDINVWPASRYFRKMWRPGIRGVTHWKFVFVDPALIQGDRDALARLVIHELVHVRQFVSGGYLRFVVGYLREYLRGRADGKDPAEAYHDIPHEREAREVTARITAI